MNNCPLADTELSWGRKPVFSRSKRSEPPSEADACAVAGMQRVNKEVVRGLLFKCENERTPHIFRVSTASPEMWPSLSM